MRESNPSYPTSGDYLTDTLSASQRDESSIVNRTDRLAMAAAAPAVIEGCPTGEVLAGEISTSQLITSLSANKSQVNYYPVQNLHGTPLKPPKHGAKGIAGVRADIIRGRLSVRELSMMGTTAIMRRYRVCKSEAIRIRRYVSEYGVDGKRRFLTGERKPLAADQLPNGESVG